MLKINNKNTSTTSILTPKLSFLLFMIYFEYPRWLITVKVVNKLENRDIGNPWGILGYFGFKLESEKMSWFF